MLTLSGTSANTYTGTTTVSAGILALSKTAGVNALAGNLTIGDGTGTDTVKLTAANQIPDTSNVTFFTGGVLDLNGNSDSVNSLASNIGGDGTVTSGVAGSVTFGVGAGNSSFSFSGLIQDGNGTLSLNKLGTGTFTLNSVYTYSGNTTVRHDEARGRQLDS